MYPTTQWIQRIWPSTGAEGSFSDGFLQHTFSPVALLLQNLAIHLKTSITVPCSFGWVDWGLHRLNGTLGRMSTTITPWIVVPGWEEAQYLTEAHRIHIQ